jgi:hypothetical protein
MSQLLLCASADDHGLQMTIVIWGEYVGSFDLQDAQQQHAIS